VNTGGFEIAWKLELDDIQLQLRLVSFVLGPMFGDILGRRALKLIFETDAEVTHVQKAHAIGNLRNAQSAGCQQRGGPL